MAGIPLPFGDLYPYGPCKRLEAIQVDIGTVAASSVVEATGQEATEHGAFVELEVAVAVSESALDVSSDVSAMVAIKLAAGLAATWVAA
jgi:hypothetical protein